MSNRFFLVFALTVVITRAFLFFYPIPGPRIGRLRTHHYMYGIVCVAVGLLIHSLTMYGIGLGLFVDELTYLFIGGETHEDNYSWISVIGTLCFVVVVFALRDYLTAFYRLI